MIKAEWTNEDALDVQSTQDGSDINVGSKIPVTLEITKITKHQSDFSDLHNTCTKVAHHVPDTNVGDMVYRAEVLALPRDVTRSLSGKIVEESIDVELIKQLQSAEPEQAKYVPDTRDCVDLSERVTATFYDDEHEEWSQKTVTIREVLDSVCDEYTVLQLPSVEPIIRCKDCKWRYEIEHNNKRHMVCDFMDCWMKDDDFCSRAERRTDE